jgi:hypothetical protein
MTRWVVALVFVAACGRSEAERQRAVARCSENSSDELEIQLCLETEYSWKTDEAAPAAAARAHELDSLEALRADSLWALSGARRRDEVRQCAGPELPRCLLTRFGWPEERARAAADSVWSADDAAHRREVQACAHERQANVGSCLMLRYKWPPDRALAVYDSIQRARMR